MDSAQQKQNSSAGDFERKKKEMLRVVSYDSSFGSWGKIENSRFCLKCVLFLCRKAPRHSPRRIYLRRKGILLGTAFGMC